ncbi:DUF6777 domain-containing protein [Kitasatospora sp. NPDC056327]|uniref:DUF6777 domain-containing protein n=1 Tax=Kitasatospora sp. NPDC056327 TaxID=3345785 RepID=UPI0035DE2807
MGGAVALAVVATVLIVNSGGGGNDDTVPTANEVALQSPQDPGPAPFTQTVETQAVQAPAPASAPAQPTATRTDGATAGGTATATLHSVEGTSAGLYGGTMNRPSCDVERLIPMTSTGDTGRAWASAQGIEQSAVPGYLRSLTSAYLRVDTRVTNHSYKGGAAVAYQSVLQAGTAVLVDAQGVPRVRCSCGNPLKPPTLVSDAKYTGKAWSGFQPTTLVVVVAAPRPVTEIVLVNIVTGGWFTRVTGQIEVVDKPAPEPRGPLAPGVPPPSVWHPATPSGTVPGSTSASASTSAPSSGGSSTPGSPSGSTSGSTGPSSGSATASTSGATSSAATPSSATASSAAPTSSSAVPTATASTTTAKPTVTSTPAATTTTPKPEGTTTGTTSAAGTGTTASNSSAELTATATGTTG